MSYQQTNTEGAGEYWGLVSNSSRFGIKGLSMTDFSAKMIYQIEFGLRLDGAKEGQSFLSQRNTFVGLKGKFGQIIAGKIDTPTKSAARNFDLSNDLVGDIRVVMVGENRENNIVRYTSNKSMDMTYEVAIIAADKSVESSTHGLSTSINYSNERAYLIMAIDSNVQSQDILRLVTGFALNKTIYFNVLYQKAKKAEGYSFSGERRVSESLAVNAVYSLDNINMKIQYAKSQANNVLENGQQLSIVTNYLLSNQSKVYSYLTALDNNAGEESYIGIGIEHKF